MSAKVIAFIPSRLSSFRLPDKPLIDICGLPMVVHVYRRALLSDVLDDVWVATDSLKIKEVVEGYGGKVILTSSDHKNGTERLAEAVEHVDCDIAMLVNGDEALVNPDYIEDSFAALLNAPDASASILVNRFYKDNSPGDFKFVLNLKKEVMYISRGDIPCSVRNPVEYRYKGYHVMAFRKDFLAQYANWGKTPIEKIEDHEHLRILEHGYKIQATEVYSTAVSVDTPEDLAFVREQMIRDPFFARYRDD